MAADAGHEAAEDALRAFQQEVRGIYAEAEERARETLTAFLEDFEEDDRLYRAQVDAGQLGEDAYKAWRKGKLLAGRRYRAVLAQCSEGYTEANQRAMDALDGRLPQVAADNCDYAAYQIDSATGLDTAYALQDADTVNVMLARHDMYLPKPSVDAAKDKRWNSRLLSSQLTQGVLLGESIPKMAARVANVTGSNVAGAVRTARTCVTAAENAGRVASYRRAEDMGIRLEQEWLATLDGRTRHSHRLLDGERVKVGEAFSNGCRYPGDPDAPAAEVMNCRCTLVAAVEGVDTSDATRWERLEPGQTYGQWRYARATEQQLRDLLRDGDGRVSKIQAEMARLDAKEAFSGIWYGKTPTLADWQGLSDSGSIDRKVAYYKDQMKASTKGDAQWTEANERLKAVRRFSKRGRQYADLQRQAEAVRAEQGPIREALAAKLKAKGKSGPSMVTYDSGRLAKALRARDGAEADKALRPVVSKAWQAATKAQRKAVFGYTESYNPINSPLNGYQNSASTSNWYRQGDYKGYGNVYIDWWGRGDQIREMTDFIDRCELTGDVWVVRGVRGTDSLDNLLGLPFGTVSGMSDAELAQLVGKSGRFGSFQSCGSLAGKGFSGDVKMEVFLPEGTKAAYAEPFSAYGSGSGQRWDGKSGQRYFSSEDETIIQRGGFFEVASITRSHGSYDVKLIHHPEMGYDTFQQDPAEWAGSRAQSAYI